MKTKEKEEKEEKKLSLLIKSIAFLLELSLLILLFYMIFWIANSKLLPLLLDFLGDNQYLSLFKGSVVAKIIVSRIFSIFLLVLLSDLCVTKKFDIIPWISESDIAKSKVLQIVLFKSEPWVYKIKVLQHNFLQSLSINSTSTLTTIGILGTFVGLSVGVADVNDVGFENKDALKPLFTAFAVSFSSSIVGIAAALLSTPIQHWIKGIPKDEENFIECLNKINESIIILNTNINVNLDENGTKITSISEQLSEVNQSLINIINGITDIGSISGHLNTIDHNITLIARKSRGQPA